MSEWEMEQKITSGILQSEIELITVRAIEFVDDFIFETIRPYCERTAQTKISKPLLKRMITEYLQNHPEEQEPKSPCSDCQKFVCDGCKYAEGGGAG